MKFDCVIIGGGPSGIFAALELKKIRPHMSIAVVEQGSSMSKRHCPIEKSGKCMHCKPYCHITSGFSGAGAFSDGKLSLINDTDETIEVGGELHSFIGVDQTKALIKYVDNIYLQFGADPVTKGIEHKPEIAAITEIASQYDVKLISIPIRHLGTDATHLIFQKIEDYLRQQGITLMLESTVTELIINNGKIEAITIGKQQVQCENCIIGVGRK